ncbi:MAG: tRNA (adenosine(37)-N6)-dimethylallyltransferase MiaA [Candidatus Omnitrophica bacterium]|nr:tRNA (adenosine(37)-N6)-dimethylallyltransferase MiaA [Candidatus Omnitrophota bacterium]
MKKKKIIFIVGPTAVGKSRLVISLAKKIDGEIVSCDSMQVYRGLDILSCKPSPTEKKQVRHHLIDVVRSSQDFDVSKFINLSRRLIEEIHKREKIPIFVGGTGLYLDCLLNGIFDGPGKNPKIRSELYKKAKVYGNNYLYRKLKTIDNQAAKKIHVHDLRRIVRALEVYQITKKPFSVLQKQRKGILQDKRFKIYIFGLNIPKEKLYENINKRVDEMFKRGVIRETKRILDKRCSKTFKQALGIKEINSYLRGEISLEQTKQLLKRNTRRYAKRQMTWFRKNPGIHWLEK